MIACKNDNLYHRFSETVNVLHIEVHKWVKLFNPSVSRIVTVMGRVSPIRSPVLIGRAGLDLTKSDLI